MFEFPRILRRSQDATICEYPSRDMCMYNPNIALGWLTANHQCVWLSWDFEYQTGWIYTLSGLYAMYICGILYCMYCILLVVSSKQCLSWWRLPWSLSQSRDLWLGSFPWLQFCPTKLFTKLQPVTLFKYTAGITRDIQTTCNNSTLRKHMTNWLVNHHIHTLY